MAGRLVKARRRTRTACTVHIIPFKKFRWYDWTCFIVAVLFLIYGIVTFIVSCVKLAELNALTGGPTRADKQGKFVKDGEVDERVREPGIEQDIYDSVDVKPAKAICKFHIVVEFLLILAMALTISWLRYLRNMCVFLFVIISMVVVICLFIALGSTSAGSRASKHDFAENIYHHISMHLSKGQDIYYLYKLYHLQFHQQCCGIHNYTDWAGWNKNFPGVLNPDSVPNSCCRNASSPGIQALQNPCSNDGILLQSPKSQLYKGIFTEGCRDKFEDKYSEFFLAFIIHAFVIVALLILFLALLLFVGNKLYQKMMNPDWNLENNPREQEDDLESDIIPGTPAKSMMSDDENTFYAP